MKRNTESTYIIHTVRELLGLIHYKVTIQQTWSFVAANNHTVCRPCHL